MQATRLLTLQATSLRSVPTWAKFKTSSPPPNSSSSSSSSSSTSASTSEPPLATNGIPVPSARPVPPRQPHGPRTDRKKNVLDSFRTLPSNQRLAIGLLLGVGAFTLYWVDQIVAPETKEEEVVRPSSWGVRVVSRDR